MPNKTFLSLFSNLRLERKKLNDYDFDYLVWRHKYFM